MWACVLVVALAAAARADCDACVSGRCHSRTTLLQGFGVTEQLAIDRANNILYAKTQPDTITGLFLDEPKHRMINVDNTTRGLAVDQTTQTLYTSHDGYVYQHRYEQDRLTSELGFKINRQTTPARLRYEDTLYVINVDGSSAYYSKNQKTFTGYDNLEDYSVTDMVNVANITHWYFVSDNKLYKFIWDNGNETSHLISRKMHVLSIDKYGEVYFGDPSKKVIFKLDRETMNLTRYATYSRVSLEDFVFDKENNIVFRDADGNVARWVPDSGALCWHH